MLLLPLRLWNVVRSLSSFITCRSLLVRNSSSVLPLEFVRLSCHAIHLELLSLAMTEPEPPLSNIISSTFAIFVSISSFLSRYTHTLVFQF